MAIGKGNSDAMTSYANKLSEGLYWEQKKKESKKYYLMAIDKDHTEALTNYANRLSEGFYGQQRKKERIWRILLKSN
jgi:TPR repeat protein